MGCFLKEESAKLKLLLIPFYMEYILPILGSLALLGAAGWFIFLKGKQKSWGDGGGLRNEELSNLKIELKNESTKKDELAGKNKQLFAELVSLKADYRNLEKEKDALNAKVAKFESEESRKRAEHKDGIEKLNNAKESLEEEKVRIRREDEARLKKESEDRVSTEKLIESIATLLNLLEK